MFQTYIETTETNRTVSKQTETTLNFPKNIETSNLSVSEKNRKNRNELFRNKPKQTETTLNFLKKDQNMLSITLFRLLACLFQFNRNTETLCFGIEPKQPNQI